MTPLRILRPFGLWNAGEIAGFPADRAAQLIAGGFAAALSEPSPQSEPEPVPAGDPRPEQTAAEAERPARRRGRE